MSERKITEAQFSMQCAWIAKNAASWAGDILDTVSDGCNEADPNAVARFTDQMRKRLDRLDEWAGRTPPPAQTQPVEAQGEPVAWQWCAHESGEQCTSWYPQGYGDRDGWEALAKRKPSKYRVEERPIYAAPQPAVTDQHVFSAAVAINPELFSTIPDEAHRAASPITVEAARQKVLDLARRALNGAFPAALHGSEKGEA